MSSSSELPAELAFLSVYADTKGPRYETATWLLSDFESATWKIQIEKPFVLDWRVRLGSSGTLLTSSRHCPLLRALKSWLIVQTHVDWTGKVISSSSHESRAVLRLLHCADYLLLHSDALQLTEHGLMAITANNLKAMLSEITSCRTISTSVYSWPERLAGFLRQSAASLKDNEFRAHLLNHPFLAQNIPDSADRMTDLTDEEIVRARTWLWKEHGYLDQQNSKGFRFSPNTRFCATRIYSGTTLRGHHVGHPIPIELGLCPDHRVNTEYPRARVVSEEDERMSYSQMRQYCTVLSSLTLVRQEGLEVPDFSKVEIDNLDQGMSFKPAGRYRTLPQQVVFSMLRGAIEFALDYGEALVDSYLNIARESAKSGESISTFAWRQGIRAFLHPIVLEMGVESWEITPGLNRSDYYAHLRSNVGLWECLRVLYGAIQVVLGTLMARRWGEAVDLVVGSCFDTSRTRLIFENRKSGIGDFREMLARPIPPIAVELMGMLEKLQQGLIDLNLLGSPTNVFSFPKNVGPAGLRILGEWEYNESLDYFCDWTQTPLDGEGKRYYVRQHQLRRFFCMLFFWGGGFGGLETLRWFLGHNDPAHLWHYITESTPGPAVRSVAAQWATYGLQHSAPETKALAAVLREHFGTSNFEVIEADVLQHYVEDLMEEGRLIIEPEFLDNGRRYQIAVSLRQKETS